MALASSIKSPLPSDKKRHAGRTLLMSRLVPYTALRNPLMHSPSKTIDMHYRQLSSETDRRYTQSTYPMLCRPFVGHWTVVPHQLFPEIYDTNDMRTGNEGMRTRKEGVQHVPSGESQRFAASGLRGEALFGSNAIVKARSKPELLTSERQ